MVKLNIKTNSFTDNALLTAGIPFAKGELQKYDELRISSNGAGLPLWWDERSYWPDNSIKWIFLHTRVPAGNNTLVLESIKSETESIKSNHAVKIKDGKLQLRESYLTILENRWTFSNPSGSWNLEKDMTATDPELELINTTWEVELIEASPIAPLLRLKPKHSGQGLRIDQFLRLDPEGRRLIWQRRMTLHKPGKYHLLSAWAKLIPGNTPDKDGSLFIIEPGKVKYNGARIVKAYPDGRWDGKDHSLWVEKAWQRSPLEISWDKKSVDLCFYPDKAKPLPVLGGTSFRHTMHLSCGDRAQDIAGHQVDFIIDPVHICRSEALGILTPSLKNAETGADLPGFEQAYEDALNSGRLSNLSTVDMEDGPAVPLEKESRQAFEYFKLQHYGDWPMPWGSYGGKKRMYASNEYDVAYAYFLGYARYGDSRFIEIARHSAIHMTDVDWISITGDMRFHGYSETAEDHGHSRSAAGELGHYWTDSYWLLYFFYGDLWAKESAASVTDYLINCLASDDENKLREIWGKGSERNLGWPLVALMGTYEATGNERIIACIKQITAFIDKFTADPDREIEKKIGLNEQPLVWWRTAMQDGCKPFMLGIVMEGLERYHRVTGDEAAARSIINLARFLIDKMWLPHQAAFIYELNAYNRGHRFGRSQTLTPLFIRGLGYAYEITGDELFKEVSEKAFHACLWTFFDPKAGGKSIGQIGRSIGVYASMLTNWINRDYKKYCSSIPASTGMPFEWNHGIKALLESDKAELIEGRPEYQGNALISKGQSFAAARLVHPASTDKGMIELTVTLNPGSTTWLNQRSYIHLCDDLHNKSCVSLISFYKGIHLRIYDTYRKLIEVPEATIEEWKEDESHKVKVEWEAPGEAVIYIDGREADRRTLDRPIGGQFTRLHIGHKPGNWRALGKIVLHTIRCYSR